MISNSTMPPNYAVDQTMEHAYNSGSNAHGAMTSTISGDQEVVLAGFHDCTAEAIRYLTEVEEINHEDPIILGLKQHLLDHQQEMDIARTLADVLTNDSDGDNEDSDNDVTEIPSEESPSPQQIQDTIDMSVLIQNNPAIAALAEEILHLINGNLDYPHMLVPH